MQQKRAIVLQALDYCRVGRLMAAVDIRQILLEHQEIPEPGIFITAEFKVGYQGDIRLGHFKLFRLQLQGDGRMAQPFGLICVAEYQSENGRVENIYRQLGDGGIIQQYAGYIAHSYAIETDRGRAGWQGINIQSGFCQTVVTAAELNAIDTDGLILPCHQGRIQAAGRLLFEYCPRQWPSGLMICKLAANSSVMEVSSLKMGCVKTQIVTPAWQTIGF